MLVENHSLKPYRRRVLGTRVLLESVLRTLGEHGAELRRATAADQALRPASLTLSWKVGGEPGRMSLAAIEQRREVARRLLVTAHAERVGIAHGRDQRAALGAVETLWLSH